MYKKDIICNYVFPENFYSYPVINIIFDYSENWISEYNKAIKELEYYNYINDHISLYIGTQIRCLIEDSLFFDRFKKELTDGCNNIENILSLPNKVRMFVKIKKKIKEYNGELENFITKVNVDESIIEMVGMSLEVIEHAEAIPIVNYIKELNNIYNNIIKNTIYDAFCYHKKVNPLLYISFPLIDEFINK